jgi:hypothetical protein
MKPFNYTILNRIFSKNSLKVMLSGHLPASIGTVIRRRFISHLDKTNGEVISEIYQFMDRNYRNEYFYKNTLLNKLIINSRNHSVNNTIALSEIPVSHSKADFILVNSHAEVYEIKTDLDNLDRLEIQIQNYYKAFDKINLVACKEKADVLVDKLEHTKIGIYKLINGRLYTMKKSDTERNYLDHKVMFKILRKQEYENILLDYFYYLPHASQFEYYTECFKLFRRIDIEKAYTFFIAELKKRSLIEKKPFMDLPYAIKSLVYFTNTKSRDIANLCEFLDSEYRRENVLSIS